PINTGAVTTDEYISEHQRAVEQGTLKFKWSSLWEPAVINPINGKSTTFNTLRVWDPYAVAFWLATLGFFSAFFSWFAFWPLVPEAVKADLKLTPVQVINSNLASLGGTAIVRFIAGPCCDRFGPRKVMAFLLVAGAIPSALVPTVTNIGGLETIRFFISILGGTFVPTQVGTTTFFDRRIVGTANAFAGGWGNLGGGVTPAVMIGLLERLRKAGLSDHLAWRVCFLLVPVPMLFLVAAMCLLLGKDCAIIGPSNAALRPWTPSINKIAYARFVADLRSSTERRAVFERRIVRAIRPSGTSKIPRPSSTFRL
ncbi:hypothetical protein OC844_007465, partial [Tilletia horrida]